MPGRRRFGLRILAKQIVPRWGVLLAPLVACNAIVGNSDIDFTDEDLDASYVDGAADGDEDAAEARDVNSNHADAPFDARMDGGRADASFGDGSSFEDSAFISDGGVPFG